MNFLGEKKVMKKKNWPKKCHPGPAHCKKKCVFGVNFITFTQRIFAMTRPKFFLWAIRVQH